MSKGCTCREVSPTPLASHHSVVAWLDQRDNIRIKKANKLETCTEKGNNLHVLQSCMVEHAADSEDHVGYVENAEPLLEPLP